jgi:hypothetical protein
MAITTAITWEALSRLHSVSYEATLERFRREWLEIVDRLRGKKR